MLNYCLTTKSEGTSILGASAFHFRGKSPGLFDNQYDYAVRDERVVRVQWPFLVSLYISPFQCNSITNTISRRASETLDQRRLTSGRRNKSIQSVVFFLLNCIFDRSGKHNQLQQNVPPSSSAHLMNTKTFNNYHVINKRILHIHPVHSPISLPQKWLHRHKQHQTIHQPYERIKLAHLRLSSIQFFFFFFFHHFADHHQIL